MSATDTATANSNDTDTGTGTEILCMHCQTKYVVVPRRQHCPYCHKSRATATVQRMLRASATLTQQQKSKQKAMHQVVRERARRRDQRQRDAALRVFRNGSALNTDGSVRSTPRLFDAIAYLEQRAHQKNNARTDDKQE